MERLAALIDKTKNLTPAWESGAVDERSALLDYWVLEVLIVVEADTRHETGERQDCDRSAARGS